MDSNPGMDVRLLDTSELVSRCAHDTGDRVLWAEFLRRFAPKLKMFIRGTLQRSGGYLDSGSSGNVLFGGAQEGDLYQNTIVKLVDRRCQVLRRFTGSTHDDFVAYLAVVTRSVVRDWLRRQRAQKRPRELRDADHESMDTFQRASNSGKTQDRPEHNVLVQEVRDLCIESIKRTSGATAERDQLIFELYFAQGLSTSQIAGCRGVGLSKAGVERVIHRVTALVRSVTGNEISRGVH